MAKRKRGTSAHSKYRHAREGLAALEARHSEVERSRPRTPAKRGWRTRRLNKLGNQVRAARGLLTKAQEAIAEHARMRTTTKRAAAQRHSEAAKKGWGKRRARTPAAPSGDIWQHLMPSGHTKTVELDKSDSSLEGKYWNAYTAAAEHRGDLESFRNGSVFDLITQKRYPFVIDLDEALQHIDEIDFGPGFYKRRNESPGNAA